MWTNVRTNGNYYQSYYRYFCSYFGTGTSSSSYRALAGDSSKTNSQWTYACIYSRCNYSGRLYCFQQEDSWTKN